MDCFVTALYFEVFDKVCLFAYTESKKKPPKGFLKNPKNETYAANYHIFSGGAR